MGCGCKGDNNLNTEEIKNSDLSLQGKLLKIPTVIIMTLIFMIISPFLLLVVWYLSIRAIYGKDSNLVNVLLGRFTKRNNDKNEVEDIDNGDDFNEEDYEIIGVDIIK